MPKALTRLPEGRCQSFPHGIDYIALRLDYSPEKNIDWVTRTEDMRGIANRAREMARRGCADKKIRKVLGLNLIRVFQAVWSRP